MVGRALGQLKARNQLVYSTKVLTPAQRQNAEPEKIAQRVRDATEASLRRLKCDFVDILFLHDVRDPATVRDTVIHKAMLREKELGKTRYLGVATHTDMANIINAVTETGVYDVVVTAFNFTMADDAELMMAIEKAAKAGVGIIAMKTQAGGARFPNPESLRNYDGSVINSAALKWVVNNPYVSTTIPGIGNFDHLRANIAVARNPEFTEQEKNFLSDNQIKLGMGFCRQCRTCVAGCPKGAEIPDLMRSHMYAVQYGDLRLARSTLDDIPVDRSLSLCRDCSDCRAQCANSVNIGAKIDELKAMYA
jgi:predicted aldo/keto reductase-like oxidoreductase